MDQADLQLINIHKYPPTCQLAWPSIWFNICNLPASHNCQFFFSLSVCLKSVLVLFGKQQHRECIENVVFSNIWKASSCRLCWYQLIFLSALGPVLTFTLYTCIVEQKHAHVIQEAMLLNETVQISLVCCAVVSKIKHVQISVHFHALLCPLK